MREVAFEDLNQGQRDNAVRMWIAAGLVARGVDIREMMFVPQAAPGDADALAGYYLPKDENGDVIFSLGPCDPQTPEFEQRVIAARTVARVTAHS
jgi:hypothetical protein